MGIAQQSVGPAPCVHDSCLLVIWLGGAWGETPVSDVCLFLRCRAIRPVIFSDLDITRCHRTGIPSGKQAIASTEKEIQQLQVS